MRTRSTLMLIALLGSASGCVAAPNPAPGADPGAEIRLPLGQSTAVAGPEFEIAFDAVVADSRCPKGEACVWEGDAIVRLSLRTAAAIQTLDLHTSSKGPAAAAYEGWTIRLVVLEPYPVAGHAVLPTGYVATLRVSRGDQVDAAIQ